MIQTVVVEREIVVEKEIPVTVVVEREIIVEKEIPVTVVVERKILVTAVTEKDFTAENLRDLQTESCKYGLMPTVSPDQMIDIAKLIDQGHSTDCSNLIEGE